VRALDKVFAVWRRADGTPVVQDAFCLHLGANLAVGGKVGYLSYIVMLYIYLIIKLRNTFMFMI
jgi:hypothetical protein